MIRELEKLGFDVDIVHQRFHEFGTNIFSARGGRTIAIITDRDRKVIVSGVALCNPTDNYCKATGRKLSIARAICQLPELASKFPKIFI